MAWLVYVRGALRGHHLVFRCVLDDVGDRRQSRAGGGFACSSRGDGCIASFWQLLPCIHGLHDPSHCATSLFQPRLLHRHLFRIAAGNDSPCAGPMAVLQSSHAAKRPAALEFVPTSKTDSDLLEFTISENSRVIGKRIMDLKLPKTALVVLITRKEDFLAPRGGTVIKEGDTLLVLAEKTDDLSLRQLLQPEDLRLEQQTADQS